MARRRRSLLGNDATPSIPIGEHAEDGLRPVPAPGADEVPTEKMSGRAAKTDEPRQMIWSPPTEDLELDPEAFSHLGDEPATEEERDTWDDEPDAAEEPAQEARSYWDDVPEEEEELFSDAEGDEAPPPPAASPFQQWQENPTPREQGASADWPGWRTKPGRSDWVTDEWEPPPPAAAPPEEEEDWSQPPAAATPSWVVEEESPWEEEEEEISPSRPSRDQGVPAPAAYSGAAPGFDEVEEEIPAWADEEEDEDDEGSAKVGEEQSFVSTGGPKTDTTDAGWDGSVWGAQKPAPRLEPRSPGFFDSDFSGGTVIGAPPPPLPSYMATGTPAPSAPAPPPVKESAKPMVVALVGGTVFALLLVVGGLALWFGGFLSPIPPTPPVAEEVAPKPAEATPEKPPVETPSVPVEAIAKPPAEVSPMAAPPAAPGTLQIRSNVRVLVSVNGEPVGYPPLNLPYPPGDYLITAQGQGRNTTRIKQEVHLDSGEIEPIRLQF